MNYVEQAIRFPCQEDWLYGIQTLPVQAMNRGILIVVGGPQYRAGSHRQFVLLARHLATDGVPVMRFDYRGMGDSEGDSRTFETVDDDLNAAVNQFFSSVPELKEVVIFGLCDAATAALLYANRDRRISGLVLINPWVRTEEGLARTYLKHYYSKRLLSADLWQKVLQGNFNYLGALRSLANALATSMFKKTFSWFFTHADSQETLIAKHATLALPERMHESFLSFKGRVLLILSGNDLTAQEFSDLANGSHGWRALMKSPRISRVELPGADHTFSRRDWRQKVVSSTSLWLASW
jgi:uncharacterized protein